MGKLIWNTLFYMVWLPVCLLMVGGVMAWAILHTWSNYIIGIGFGLWLAILLFAFYIGFPLFTIYKTHTDPNSRNQYGVDFNLEEAREHIKEVHE
jgi:hypothetical protein